MTRMTRRIALSVTLFMMSAGISMAACTGEVVQFTPDTKQTQEKQTPAQAEKDVQRWIDQLNSDQFKDRERASQELRKLGKAALPGLKKALKHSDAEIRHRVADLIAQIDPPSAPAPAKAENVQAQGRAIQIQIGGAQVRPAGGIQVIQLGPAGLANPAGVQRTIKITEGPQGIVMTVTKIKDGKEVKKEYKAKDAKEFEKKYPEAYKIYKGSTDLLPDLNKPRFFLLGRQE